MISQSIFRSATTVALVLMLAWSLGPAVRAQNGHTLSAVGPANQSMGGAGVAHPTDAIGAVHWNPASIAALGGKQFSMGIDFFMPSAELTSSMKAGSVGGAFPPVDLKGT